MFTRAWVEGTLSASNNSTKSVSTAVSPVSVHIMLISLSVCVHVSALFCVTCQNIHGAVIILNEIRLLQDAGGTRSRVK